MGPWLQADPASRPSDSDLRCKAEAFFSVTTLKNPNSLGHILPLSQAPWPGLRDAQPVTTNTASGYALVIGSSPNAATSVVEGSSSRRQVTDTHSSGAFSNVLISVCQRVFLTHIHQQSEEELLFIRALVGTNTVPRAPSPLPSTGGLGSELRGIPVKGRPRFHLFLLTSCHQDYSHLSTCLPLCSPWPHLMGPPMSGACTLSGPTSVMLSCLCHSLYMVFL